MIIDVTVDRAFLDAYAPARGTSTEVCPIAAKLRESLPYAERVSVSQWMIFVTLTPGLRFRGKDGLASTTRAFTTPAKVARWIDAWDSALADPKLTSPELRIRLHAPGVSIEQTS